MEKKQDDEVMWGLEGGYSSDRGLSRHSLDYHSGCGAHLGGSKSNTINLILRLFLYHFLHTMSL